MERPSAPRQEPRGGPGAGGRAPPALIVVKPQHNCSILGHTDSPACAEREAKGRALCPESLLTAHSRLCPHMRSRQRAILPQEHRGKACQEMQTWGRRLPWGFCPCVRGATQGAVHLAVPCAHLQVRTPRGSQVQQGGGTGPGITCPQQPRLELVQHL